jgi:hypothetical protein
MLARISGYLMLFFMFTYPIKNEVAIADISDGFPLLFEELNMQAFCGLGSSNTFLRISAITF